VTQTGDFAFKLITVLLLPVMMKSANTTASGNTSGTAALAVPLAVPLA
jgi:hypothetical protein